MSQKITMDELKKLLIINNNRTIDSYVSKKLIPCEYDLDGNTLFDRKQILSILGLKPDNDEPLITSKEAIQILGINHLNKLGSFLKSRKIPHYVIKNEKGMQRYFLRSEIDAALKFSYEWDNDFPDYVARTFFLAETIKFIFNTSLISGLTDYEQKLLDDIIFHKKSLKEKAEEDGVSRERIRQKFQLACKKVNFGIRILVQKINNVKNISLENEKFKIENKILLEKLNDEQYTEIGHANTLNAYDLKITHFDLSVRCLNALKDMEVDTLGRLTEMSRDDVRKYRKVGYKTVQEIDRLLLQNGLTWNDKKKIDVPVVLSKIFEKDIVQMHNKLQSENKTLRSELHLLRQNKFKDNLNNIREQRRIQELEEEIMKLKK